MDEEVLMDERMVEECIFSSISRWVLSHIVEETLRSESIGLGYENIRFSFEGLRVSFGGVHNP